MNKIPIQSCNVCLGPLKLEDKNYIAIDWEKNEKQSHVFICGNCGIKCTREIEQMEYMRHATTGILYRE